LWEWTDSLGIRSLSYGGVAAPNDFWAFEDNDSVAGLVLLASRLRQDTCAEIDFSNTNYPMANVQASLDGIIKPAWMASSSQLGWHHQASLDGIINKEAVANTTELFPLKRCVSS
jgi:hypothetical protein